MKVTWENPGIDIDLFWQCLSSDGILTGDDYALTGPPAGHENVREYSENRINILGEEKGIDLVAAFVGSISTEQAGIIHGGTLRPTRFML